MLSQIYRLSLYHFVYDSLVGLEEFIYLYNSSLNSNDNNVCTPSVIVVVLFIYLFIQ